MPRAPALENVVRQHAEMAAFLWTVYDRALLYPDENPEMDAERLARLVERLDAHLDGLRVAGEDGRRIAAERYAAYPEAGELFVMRMLEGSAPTSVAEIDIGKARRYLSANSAQPL